MTVKTHLRALVGAGFRSVPPFRGKTRIARLADSVLTDRLSFEVQDNIGARFVVSGTSDMIEREIVYNGSYSNVISQALSALLRPGDVFWDAGANIGSVSIPVLTANPGVKGYLFEPSPAVAGRLLANLAANPEVSARSVLCTMALGRASGPLTFYPSDAPGNSGVGGLMPAANRAARGVTVQVHTAQSLIEQVGFPRPNVMKMDVEGFELDVLEGFGSLLTGFEDMAIIYEHANYRLRERNQATAVVWEFLESKGFTMHAFSGEALSVSQLPHNDMDIVALKGSYRKWASRRP